MVDYSFDRQIEPRAVAGFAPADRLGKPKEH